MATPNTLNAYQLLRRAMEQQSAQQQGDDGNSPSLVPEQSPDGDQAPQGLLGRLRALLAEQGQYQPVGGTDGSMSAQPLDPNFRQLSRAPVASRPQVAGDPANRSAVQFGRTYASDGGGDPSLDSQIATGRSATPPQTIGGLLGASAPSWMIAPPPITPARVGWRIGGVPVPLPWPPSSPPPRIPVPSVPEWWKVAGELLQVYPRVFSGLAAGGGDDEECKKQLREAHEICVKAYENGWKSSHDVGPYSTSSGDTWDVNDCMRGLVSEDCGGNPKDNEPRKNGKRKRGRR